MSSARAAASEWMLQVDVDGQRLEGSPLAWSAEEVFLLGRDGRVWQFSPSAATNYARTSDRFRSYSTAELRTSLLREFGQGFDVSGTGHYLVVHPAGQRDQWAPRFEQLYRSFLHYFTARGLPLQTPEFPLVAVVFPRQEDFLRYVAKEGLAVDSNTLGFYSLQSNRVLLFDVTARTGRAEDWSVNAETIIHEAAHQTAFNTGVHSRFSAPPRWVVEGLGTLFEARGVWDSLRYTQRADRIHPGQLNQFRSSTNEVGFLEALITSDQPFRTDPATAYAQSWALTFFLTERMPRQYADYLRRTTMQPAFQDYDPAERRKDFVDAFGADLRMLEARMQRFLNEL